MVSNENDNEGQKSVSQESDELLPKNKRGRKPSNKIDNAADRKRQRSNSTGLKAETEVIELTLSTLRKLWKCIVFLEQ